MPTMFQHAVRTYRAMLDEAKRVPIDGDEDENGYMIVYEGYLTRLITEKLDLSVPFYTDITRALKAMGCVKQLKRGGGTAASQWELIREPNTEEFMDYMGTPSYEKLGRPTNSALVRRATEGAEQRMNDLARRVNRIEQLLNLPPLGN